MRGEDRTWAELFRPKTLREIADNEKALSQFLSWLKSWDKGFPEKRAAFLYGPPGVGKTSAVEAAARDLRYDLLELNASDFRTAKRIEALIGRAHGHETTVLGRRRMILFDELEGISDKEDSGGVQAILSIIKETRNPIVLIATSIHEGWEQKFRQLREASLVIEFRPIPFIQIVERLRVVARTMGITVEDEVLERIAEVSEGDLRSAINDLEALARGRSHVSASDASIMVDRDRALSISQALGRIFSAGSLVEAREALASAYLPHEDLVDWIYENMPYFFDDPRDLLEGLEALSRADIYEGRTKRLQEYRLLKYVLDWASGGVALSRRSSDGRGLAMAVESKLEKLGFQKGTFSAIEAPNGIHVRPNRYLGNDWGKVNTLLRDIGGSWMKGEGFWLVPYFRQPQIIWRYGRTKVSREHQRRVAESVAEKSHISKRRALREVIPFLKVIFKEAPERSAEILKWLGLGEYDAEWLKS
ncbi:replication factor C large subunit [Candidatus Bathyarchaeota archaeon]|nr:replication factor C large subunit [Candidatus Bathyarchaeota archaeon]